MPLCFFDVDMELLTTITIHLEIAATVAFDEQIMRVDPFKRRTDCELACEHGVTKGIET